ncbi:MAG: methylenetetrahydrofolate reductase [Saccharofermentanales bacterium]
MKYQIENKMYLLEVLPPKQNTEKLDVDLENFANKYQRVVDSGYCACITDNAMGLLAFQGTELIDELELPVVPEQVMIHLNTFHTLEDLNSILDSCKAKGIKYLLIVSGDGSERLPRLAPSDIGYTDVKSVTSVELLKYIGREYPGIFILGVAFNPYEPEEHEFAKMERKIEAGATFIITQPIIDRNPIVDKLQDKYPDVPLVIEAWMSKKLSLLAEAVGYEIADDGTFDPIEALKALHRMYPKCGFYLSLLSYKNQYELIEETWV